MIHSNCNVWYSSKQMNPIISSNSEFLSFTIHVLDQSLDQFDSVKLLYLDFIYLKHTIYNMNSKIWLHSYYYCLLSYK